MAIVLDCGLAMSETILSLIRNDRRLHNLDIDLEVGCFNNCREQGFTFTLVWYRDMSGKLQRIEDPFTWCVYEHRNSDNIIVNGKANWSGMAGELPYKSDDKHDHIVQAGSGDHIKVASWLVENFLRVVIKDARDKNVQLGAYWNDFTGLVNKIN